MHVTTHVANTDCDMCVECVCTALRASLASHTLRRERPEGSGHAATIELSPRQKLDVTNQKLDVTNQIRALRGSHPLSWSTITSQRV